MTLYDYFLVRFAVVELTLFQLFILICWKNTLWYSNTNCFCRIFVQ